MSPGISYGADSSDERYVEETHEDGQPSSSGYTPDKTELKTLIVRPLATSVGNTVNTEHNIGNTSKVSEGITTIAKESLRRVKINSETGLGDGTHATDEIKSDALLVSATGVHTDASDDVYEENGMNEEIMDEIDKLPKCRTETDDVANDKSEWAEANGEVLGEIDTLLDSRTNVYVAVDDICDFSEANGEVLCETDKLLDSGAHIYPVADTICYERSETNEEVLGETDVLLDNETRIRANDRGGDMSCDGNTCQNGFEGNVNDAEIVEEETKAPDGGWGWFIILGALILRMIAGGLGRSHGLFYIKFVDRYGATATATAFVTALTGLFRIGTGPFVSILCTRVQCRTLTFIGTCLLSTGLIMTGFSPSLHFLYFSYGAVSGLGRAFALTPVPILLGYYFDKRRSLAFGLASAGFSLGGFCITPVVEVFFQTFGFQGTYLLLGGIALNMAVCSALFRPIELHRKITQYRSKQGGRTENSERIIVRSIENIQAGDDLSSSTISIERVKTRSNKANNRKDSGKTILDRGSENRAAKSIANLDTRSNVGNGTKSKRCETCETEVKPKKKPLVAWSILKDVRFLCFCFANFLLTLPTNGLFLPSLAKARGASDMQAASLLSIGAGSDTVFRVISGFVLDMKLFRHIRPQIYSTVLLVSGTISLLYPLAGSYTALVLLVIVDGLATGVKAAQNSVVVMDILGVDKLASSQVVTMSVQSTAIIIGSVVSGRLKDMSGVYDGVFYFGGCAILLAGLVMTGGNVRKYVIDRRERTQEAQQESQDIINV